MTALAIARRCSWRYEWVEALPHDVYEILLEELHKEDRAAARASGHGRRVMSAGEW